MSKITVGRARPRGRMRPHLAAATAVALALGVTGPAVLAGEGDPQDPIVVEDPAPDEPAEDEPTSVSDALLANARIVIDAAGLEAEVVLGEDITAVIPDGQGGTIEVTAPIGEVLERLGEGLTLEDGDAGDDGEDPSEPRLNAGGTFHLAANLSLETFALVPEADLPPAPDVRPYDVIESEYVPDTPMVPGINPLILAAALAGVSLPDELVELAPGLDDPILLLHPGGPLTSVQGGDWSVLGAHGAGSYGLGHNVDTGARETSEDDPWPFWVPFVTGELMVPDQSVDFLGFGIIVNTGDCTLIRASTNPASPLYSRILSRICLGAGAIIGDGVAQFDGSHGIDFREDLLPLWEPAPEELEPVLEAVGELSGAVDELTGSVLDALDLVDLDELTDPDGSTEAEPGVPSGGPLPVPVPGSGDASGAPLDAVLEPVGRLLP